MPRASSAVVAAAAYATVANGLVPGPWSDWWMDPVVRAAMLVKNMTLDEKLVMLHGPSKGAWGDCDGDPICLAANAYVGNVAGNTRLGIPPINMNDGPQGFRDNANPRTTTAWPSGLTMAASWDEDAMYEWGVGMGKEFYAKGANVQLGPGLNVARVPRNGRNFEYLSGEDPFLGKTLVKPVIRGIQSQKVLANAKHWVLNNQETARFTVSAEASERTRYEVYYPPFEGAVEAGVGSFMCGYNKINGIWSCENPVTLKEDLKGRLGFKGYVMSDWGATHSTSLKDGLDMEMPSSQFMNAGMLKADLKAGVTTQQDIDEALMRIMTPMFEFGVMDEPLSAWDSGKLKKNVTTEDSVASARRLSGKTTVMLKNEKETLPLPQNARLALIGFAADNSVVHAGGSGSVVASHVVSPLEGIAAAAGEGARIHYVNGTDMGEAAEWAAFADYAIVFVATLSSEGRDRVSLSLDDGCEPDAEGQCVGNHKQQNELIRVVAQANPRTIVVASVPGAVLMPWSGDVASILVNFMPGQQAGHAIADVLFGKVNPSAKLPLTFPNVENETEMAPWQWPGVPDPTNPTYAYYTEGLLYGYRFYDEHKITFTTGYPFGHGLSYTTFAYTNMKVLRDSTPDLRLNVTFDVINTGKVMGAEVAQVYVQFPSSAGEPPLQLRGFRKTRALASGQEESVTVQIASKDLSTWSEESHAWEEVKGEFTFYAGASSRDIRLTGTFTNSDGPLVV